MNKSVIGLAAAVAMAVGFLTAASAATTVFSDSFDDGNVSDWAVSNSANVTAPKVVIRSNTFVSGPGALQPYLNAGNVYGRGKQRKISGVFRRCEYHNERHYSITCAGTRNLCHVTCRSGSARILGTPQKTENSLISERAPSTLTALRRVSFCSFRCCEMFSADS